MHKPIQITKSGEAGQTAAAVCITSGGSWSHAVHTLWQDSVPCNVFSSPTHPDYPSRVTLHPEKVAVYIVWYLAQSATHQTLHTIQRASGAKCRCLIYKAFVLTEMWADQPSSGSAVRQSATQSHLMCTCYKTTCRPSFEEYGVQLEWNQAVTLWAMHTTGSVAHQSKCTPKKVNCLWRLPLYWR